LVDSAPAQSDEHEAWLRTLLPKHGRLVPAVKSLLENMLQRDQIEYLSISGRVKKLESALEKIRRKQYAAPQQQITDLSGIRVITFLEGQVERIGAVIRDLFEVDKPNSLDRAAILGRDRIGYRSTHFVCSLGEKRGGLPEYKALGDLKFEIQVRTVLQHAWAELAHDRSFKFGAALPTAIERKLNLYSGLLEITDRAFDEISKEIDDYRESIERTTINQLSSAGVDSISISKYIGDFARSHGITLREPDASPNVISQLRRFGLSNIGQLEELVTPEFVANFSHSAPPTNTATGILRLLMMYHDLDKYFSDNQIGEQFHPHRTTFWQKNMGRINSIGRSLCTALLDQNLKRIKPTIFGEWIVPYQ
jgi:putative GTP pyrophosphokinase